MDRAREILARARPARLDLPGRGVEIALLDWGGSGPVTLLHHANGFCKGTWGLVADALRPHFRVLAMDARGHGDSSRPRGEGAYAWEQFALDLAAVAERVTAEWGSIALAIGHSFGGTATLGAAAAHPGLFRRMLLVDPVAPPRPGGADFERNANARSLAERAGRRRADWPSRAEARGWWAERELFARWRPEAIDLYALDGLRERADGSVELKCPGAVEAAVFAGSAGYDIFSVARGVATPALWLWAAQGNFSRAVYEDLAGSMAAARVETVDAGHLIPMEQPERVVDAALRLAASHQDPSGDRAEPPAAG